MVKLFGFGANFGVVDPSPFVLKVDAYLRMANIPFEYKASFSNLQKSPKGKLPYIEDDGEIIADSFFILQYVEKKYQVSLDDHLSAEQKALAHLIAKSLDENLYWCMVYSRWLKEETWPVVKQAFFGTLPFPLKYIIPYVARRNIRTQFVKHGMGKHSDAEIMMIADTSLQSLATLIGDKHYVFGDRPSRLDATLYGFLAQAIMVDLDSPLNRKAREYAPLVAYCQRIHQQFYTT